MIRTFTIRCPTCNGSVYLPLPKGQKLKCPNCINGSISVKEYREDIKNHAHLFNRSQNDRNDKR